MIASIPEVVANGKYDFHAYTRFTEDIQPASRLKLRLDADSSLSANESTYEIEALPDANGIETIFFNTGEEIICFYLKDEGHHTFKQVSIPVKGASKMVAKIHRERIHLFFLMNSGLYAAIEKTPGSKEFEVSEPLGKFNPLTHLTVFDFNGALYVGVGGYSGNAYCSLHILGQERSIYGYGFPGSVLDIAIDGSNVYDTRFYCIIKESPGKMRIFSRNLIGSAMLEHYCPQDNRYYDFRLIPGDACMYYRFSYGDKSQFNTLHLLQNKSSEQEDNGLLYTDSYHEGELFQDVKIDTESGSSIENFSAYRDKITYMFATSVLSADRKSLPQNFFYLTNSRFVHEKWDDMRIAETFSKTILDWKVNTACMSGGNNPHLLYYVAMDVSGDYRIIRLEYDPDNERWEEYDITLSGEERMIDLPCYTTEVTFYETDTNRPAPGLTVTLYPEEPGLIDTPLGIREVGKDKKLTLTTDISGKIYFTQYCDTVFVPNVVMEVPAMELNGRVIVINQMEEVKNRLKTMTKADIANGKKTDPHKENDEFLLSDRSKADQNAQAIKSSLDQIFAAHTLSSLDPRRIGAYVCDAGETGELLKFQANTSARWSLSVEDGQLIYRNHTQEEADEIMASMQPGVDNGISEWFSSIGSFVRSIGKAIVKVVKLVVNGVKAALTFVLDGVSYVLNWVFDKISVVLDAVATIFATVLVFFVDFFLWLGFQIRWKDVLRTKKALNQAMLLGFNMIPKQMRTYGKVVLDKLEFVKANVRGWADEAQRKIGSNTIEGYQRSHQNPDLESAASNNMMLRKMESADLGFYSMGFAETLENSDIFDILQRICDKLDVSSEFKHAADYLKQGVSQPDKFFKCVLSAFLEIALGVVNLVLDGVGLLIEGLLNLVESLITELESLMVKKINIPFFSTLYKGIAKDELSFMDLASLVIGFFATVVHKLTFDEVPFPNDSKMNDFINQMNGAAAVASGENSGNALAVASWVSKMMRFFGYIAGGVSVFTAGLDSSRLNSDQDNKSATGLALFTLGLQIIWLVLSAPWFHTSGVLHWFAGFMWGFFIFTFLIDAIFAKASVKENLYLIYIAIGVIHIILSLIHTVVGLSVCSDLIVELCVSVQQILTCVAGMSKNPETKAVCAAIDFFLMFGVIIAGMMSIFNAENEEVQVLT